MDIKSIPIAGTLAVAYEEALPHADPRTRNWLLLEGTPIYVWAATALYLAIVWLGPKYMRTRQAFNVPIWFIVIYNLGLVALSIYMFLGIITNAYRLRYNVLCAVYNDDTHKNPEEMPMAKVLWWFFFSKLIEFGDTFLMIARKKNNQITFLHVFHHATMLNIWWFTMTFVPGGCAFFSSSINSFVHIVMYSYYGLSVIPYFKEKLWWKKYITKLQLLQFFVTLIHTLQTLRPECDFPDPGKYMLASYMLMLIALFSNFYMHAYLKKKTKDANANEKLNHSAANGVNGVTHVNNNKRIQNGKPVNKTD